MMTSTLEWAKARKRVTLQVSNYVLITSSEHFLALISPGFREGQEERSAASLQKICFEDDNSKVMQDLCGLLHDDEMAELYARATSGRSLHLAAVDKYDCLGRLRLHTSTMLFNFLDEYQKADAANRYSAKFLPRPISSTTEDASGCIVDWA